MLWVSYNSRNNAKPTVIILIMGSDIFWYIGAFAISRVSTSTVRKTKCRTVHLLFSEERLHNLPTKRQKSSPISIRARNITTCLLRKCSFTRSHSASCKTSQRSVNVVTPHQSLSPVPSLTSSSRISSSRTSSTLQMSLRIQIGAVRTILWLLPPLVDLTGKFSDMSSAFCPS